MQFTSFLKNIALAGGFLILFVNGAKDFSLDNKLNKQNCYNEHYSHILIYILHLVIINIAY